jgi:hypothetical protein
VVKSGFIVVVTLVMVASAAGSPGRTNGDLLLLRGQHLFVVTSAGTDVRELTPQGFNVESAAWSRSGRRVAMGANKHIWVMNADGAELVARRPLDRVLQRPDRVRPGLGPSDDGWADPAGLASEDLVRQPRLVARREMDRI